jgi:hypothetical protein
MRYGGPTGNRTLWFASQEANWYQPCLCLSCTSLALTNGHLTKHQSNWHATCNSRRDEPGVIFSCLFFKGCILHAAPLPRSVHLARRLAMKTCKSTRSQHAGHDPRWIVSFRRKCLRSSLKMSPDKCFLDIIGKNFIEKFRWWLWIFQSKRPRS